jgi:hypothetical protein
MPSRAETTASPAAGVGDAVGNAVAVGSGVSVGAGVDVAVRIGVEVMRTGVARALALAQPANINRASPPSHTTFKSLSSFFLHPSSFVLYPIRPVM